MKIPIGSDHAGFPAKEKVKQILVDLGYEPLDQGTFSEESVDYPDFAYKVASMVGNGEYELGIVICGSGQGVCMTANKVDHVRAALVYNDEVAALTRQHNNANVMCLPGRTLSDEELKTIVKKFFETPFEGGRHGRRVQKIHEITHH
ncbi:ribose 5-phosphate isomerase B [bacterium]|nr:MAG: ribose 5-phosphate isomerase B [bacterium]